MVQCFVNIIIGKRDRAGHEETTARRSMVPIPVTSNPTFSEIQRKLGDAEFSHYTVVLLISCKNEEDSLKRI